MEKQKMGVGRRKEAVTRIFMSKGDGKIIVNDKDYKVYFPLVYLQNQVDRPLRTLELANKFDIKINALRTLIKQSEKEIAQATQKIADSERVRLTLEQELNASLVNCVAIKQIHSTLTQLLPVFLLGPPARTAS